MNLGWIEEGPEHPTSTTSIDANRLRQPAIPVTYLLAQTSGWEGPPGYEAVVLDRIDDDVAGFSPGVVVKVKSPHYRRSRSASPRRSRR